MSKATTVGRKSATPETLTTNSATAPIGGLKVMAKSGWFAARPSVTENIYKIYAESFKTQTHLNAIVSEAHEIVSNALGGRR